MPTDPTPAAMEKAREIVRAYMPKDSGPDGPAMERAIARAIDEARKVPDGYVREGVTDRKVLGTLPLTADGEVIGGLQEHEDFLLYSVHPKDGEIREMTTPAYWSELDDWRVNAADPEPDGSYICQPLSWCYSTRAAAEAARKGGE